MTCETFINARLVRRRRDQLAVPLRALATAVGVAPSVIVTLEQGRNHPQLTFGHLARIADALAVDIAELLDVSDEAPPDNLEIGSDDHGIESSADDVAAVGAVRRHLARALGVSSGPVSRPRL